MNTEMLKAPWTSEQLELCGAVHDATSVLAGTNRDGERVIRLGFLYGRQTRVSPSQTNVVLTLEAATVLRHQLNEAIAGVLDAESETRVAPEDACPRCGEYHQDSLVWQDDGRIHCTNCGTRYEPDARPDAADQPQLVLADKELRLATDRLKRCSMVYTMDIRRRDPGTWEQARSEMIKTLTKHGNSYALIIDRAILELLRINAETPLEITTDGKKLTITPIADPKRRRRLDAALENVNRRYGRTLKKLAE